MEDKTLQKAYIKSLNGLDTLDEEIALLDDFLEYANAFDSEEAEERILNHDRKMNKIIVSKYGIIPSNETGMYTYLNILVKEFEKIEDYSFNDPDSIYMHCVNIIDDFCENIECETTKFDDELESEIKKNEFKTDISENDLTEMWELIKKRIEDLIKKKDIQNLPILSSALNIFSIMHMIYISGNYNSPAKN